MKDSGFGIRRTARKEYECYFCHVPIEVGTVYLRFGKKIDGKWVNVIGHYSCRSEALKFYDDLETKTKKLPNILKEKLVAQKEHYEIGSSHMNWPFVQATFHSSWRVFFDSFFSHIDDFKKDKRLLFTYLHQIFPIHKLYKFFDSRNIFIIIQPAVCMKDLGSTYNSPFTFKLVNHRNILLADASGAFLSRANAEVAAFEKAFKILNDRLNKVDTVLDDLKEDTADLNGQEITNARVRG